LKLAPEELKIVDNAITWSTAKKDRLGRELIGAVKSRDLGRVKAAVEAGANIEARDAEQNATPFLWAIYVNALEIARYLVEKGADVHAVGKHNRNAMHDAVGAFNDKISRNQLK